MNDTAKKLIKLAKDNDIDEDELMVAIEQLYVKQLDFMLAKYDRDELENTFTANGSRITIHATRELLN